MLKKMQVKFTTARKRRQPEMTKGLKPSDVVNLVNEMKDRKKVSKTDDGKNPDETGKINDPNDPKRSENAANSGNANKGAKNNPAQNAGGPGGTNKANKANATKDKKDKDKNKTKIDFEPNVERGDVLKPGDLIGKFKVTKKKEEEPNKNEGQDDKNNAAPAAQNAQPALQAAGATTDDAGGSQAIAPTAGPSPQGGAVPQNDANVGNFQAPAPQQPGLDDRITMIPTRNSDLI